MNDRRGIGAATSMRKCVGPPSDRTGLLPVRIVELPVAFRLRRGPGRLWVGVAALVLAVGVAAIGVGVGPAAAATAPVGLGTAARFAVLAGSTVTNTGPSVINGDLGVAPGSAVTGFPSGLVHGAVHSADAVARQAKSDLVVAYNDAAGRPTTATVTADLGASPWSRVFTPGPPCR